MDNRERPVSVSVQYYGRPSEEMNSLEQEDMYRMTVGEMRQRFYICDLDGLTSPFAIDNTSSSYELENALIQQGVSEEIRDAIHSVASEGDFSSKFARLFNNQIMVIVNYSDSSTKRASTQIFGSTANTSSSRGFGA